MCALCASVAHHQSGARDRVGDAVHVSKQIQGSENRDKTHRTHRNLIKPSENHGKTHRTQRTYRDLAPPSGSGGRPSQNSATIWYFTILKKSRQS